MFLLCHFVTFHFFSLVLSFCFSFFVAARVVFMIFFPPQAIFILFFLVVYNRFDLIIEPRILKRYFFNYQSKDLSIC
jgi:hypothetical protein